ncbi:hypothetical protein [Galbibacter pacificus]|uniref:Uncharacterized protein n=1 Tax=Galbibacter pacificus TaxID=2996052 RepID=A0ABT6FR70_9FLAO|nr:hypothetical protein [Galbibacter pacificus]MDG3581758.1 hypothetical protein [Galbibacter pacificus]MDG3585768.1 hypothetical protein [Galbibacter pacificus]
MEIFDNNKIIEDELNAIRDDILTLYNNSNKRTSGQFEKDLTIELGNNMGSLLGNMTLQGRKAGKQPPIEAIEQWIEEKGIKPLEEKMSTSTLAYLIARKIGQEGTDKENHLYVYDKIITPDRIQSIIDRLTVFNAQMFINEVTITIKESFKNI